MNEWMNEWMNEYLFRITNAAYSSMHSFSCFLPCIPYIKAVTLLKIDGYTCCNAFDKHWILFSFMWHLPRLSQGRTHGRPKCALGWLQKLTHVPLAIAIHLVGYSLQSRKYSKTYISDIAGQVTLVFCWSVPVVCFQSDAKYLDEFSAVQHPL